MRLFAPSIELPPIRLIPWKMKDVTTALTEKRILDNGRLQLRVRHEVLSGVTPKMLVWWFSNLDGDMEIGGRLWSRYQIWHPIDHISIKFIRRRQDRTIGPGAQIHIREVLGGRLDYLIDMVTTIEKLDETGFIHVVRRFGQEVVRLEHKFTCTEEGTIDENSATFGPATPVLCPLFNMFIRPHVFPDDKARAWFKHNVEEIGNLEFFLPELFVGFSEGW